ncbi:MAG: 2-oxo-4-hydroxy-4-carboxy-5-ureidoimidazoline decarboxylase [Stappiaceae bacterium]
MANQDFPLSLNQINAMSVAEFVATFADVAEHSPWVAEAAARFRPFANRKSVVAGFAQAMLDADPERQLALIRAHPDLAGKAAQRGELAEASRKEQDGAGLDSLTSEEFERFTAFNNKYLSQFGFPFIFAVKGADKHMILEAFQARVTNEPEVEFQTALVQISRIFRFRLEDRIKNDVNDHECE